MREKIKSLMVNTALLIYNIVIFIAINIVLWCNHIWRPRKWTKVKLPKR